MVHIDEGYEDKALKDVVRELNYMANRVQNMMIHYRPAYHPQATVRKEGHELKGALSLAISIASSMGRRVPDQLHAKCAEIALKAATFDARTAAR